MATKDLGECANAKDEGSLTTMPEDETKCSGEALQPPRAGELFLLAIRLPLCAISLLTPVILRCLGQAIKTGHMRSRSYSVIPWPDVPSQFSFNGIIQFYSCLNANWEFHIVVSKQCCGNSLPFINLICIYY